jgi:hypothetical protein
MAFHKVSVSEDATTRSLWLRILRCVEAGWEDARAILPLGSRGAFYPLWEEEVGGLTCPPPTAYLLLGQFLPRELRGGFTPRWEEEARGPNVPPTSYLLLKLGQAWRLQAP